MSNRPLLIFIRHPERKPVNKIFFSVFMNPAVIYICLTYQNFSAELRSKSGKPITINRNIISPLYELHNNATGISLSSIGIWSSLLIEANNYCQLPVVEPSFGKGRLICVFQFLC
jgi:hypothetical protein